MTRLSLLDPPVHRAAEILITDHMRVRPGEDVLAALPGARAASSG